MGRYAGSLRTHEDDIALSASLELENGRVRINIGETPIGDWAVQEVEFEKTDSGYRIVAEGDHVLLDLEPKDAVALGIQLSDLDSERKGRRSKGKSTTNPQRGSKSAEEPPSDEKPSRRRFRRSKSSGEAAPEVQTPTEPMPDRTEPHPTSSGPAPAAEEKPPSNGDEIARILTRMADAEPGPAAPTPAPPTSTYEPVAEAEEKPKKSKRKERARRPKREKKEKAPTTRSSLGGLLTTKTPLYLDRILDSAEPRLKPYLPAWVFNRLTVLVVLTGVVLIPIFPGFMATVLLVLGGLTVMFGAVVYTDSVLSSRFLYGRTTPNHVLVVGVSTVVIGIILTLIAT